MLLGRSSSTEVLSPGQSPITSTFSLIGSSSTDNDVHICLINHLRIRGWIAILALQGIPWQWLGFPYPPRSHRPAPLLPRLPPPHPLPLGQAQGHHGHYRHHDPHRPPSILPAGAPSSSEAVGRKNLHITLDRITKGRNTPEQSCFKINIHTC